MKKMVKKSEMLREGYVKGLREAQRIINEMLITESISKITNKALYGLYDYVIVVPTEFEHMVECGGNSPLFYNAGVNGHNYNVYDANDFYGKEYKKVAIVSGSRPCAGIDVDRQFLLRLRKEYDSMDFEQRQNENWIQRIVNSVI